MGPGDVVLDIAAGTGVSTVELARTGATCLAADFSIGMLRAGRPRHPEVPYLAADAMRLPLPDASVDAVVMSFGLRNVVDPDAALAEFARVTRPGGTLARAVRSNPDAYVYLAESIRAWPAQPARGRRIAAAGWGAVSWRDLTGGIVALHSAVRP